MKNFSWLAIVLLTAGLLVAVGCKKETKPATPAGAAKPSKQPKRAIEKMPEAPELPPAATEAAPQSKPATAPASAPSEKPAPETQAAPAAVPAAALVAPADAPKVKTAWADAKVGTMIKMKSLGEVEVTMEVVAVNEETVTLKTTTKVGEIEQANESPMPRYASAGSPLGSAEMGKKVGTETITVAGEPLECEVWEMETKVGDQTIKNRMYMNKSVPGWTVRVDSDSMGQMQPITELVEYRK